jgi:hypothetical protein
MLLRKWILAKQDGRWIELAELLRLVAVIHRVLYDRWNFVGTAE